MHIMKVSGYEPFSAEVELSYCPLIGLSTHHFILRCIITYVKMNGKLSMFLSNFYKGKQFL